MLHILHLELFNGRCCYNCGVSLSTSVAHLEDISTLDFFQFYFLNVVIKLDISHILFFFYILLQIPNLAKEKNVDTFSL